jgi:hypothetical protein
MFPGFNRCGLSRKPASAAQRHAKQLRLLDRICLSHLQLLVGPLLTPIFAALAQSLSLMQGKQSRRRTFTHEVTFWAFLAQVIDVDSSCRRALTRVQRLRQGAGLSTIDSIVASKLTSSEVLAI